MSMEKATESELGNQVHKTGIDRSRVFTPNLKNRFYPLRWQF
jgi:hypothetical protein